MQRKKEGKKEEGLSFSGIWPESAFPRRSCVSLEENERKGSLSRLKNVFSASGSRQKSVSDGRKPQHEQTSVQFCSAGAEDCPSDRRTSDAKRTPAFLADLFYGCLSFNCTCDFCLSTRSVSFSPALSEEIVITPPSLTLSGKREERMACCYAPLTS